MRLLFLAFLLSLCLPMELYALAPAQRVRVIGNIPVNSTYNWWIDGRSTVSCRGAECTSHFSLPSSGAAEVSGAVLKLLKEDGTIVIAACLEKERIAADVVATMAGLNHSTTYRDCRMPDPSTLELDAEFHTSSVRLSFTNPDSDKSGRIFTETYLIKGFLHPRASDELVVSTSFFPESGDRAQACGPLKVRMKVHTEKASHPAGPASEGQALLYFIQQDEFTVKVLGYFPTRFAVDGQWVGGNHNDSYFFVPVAAGDHQLCAEWEIEFSHHILPVSFARMTFSADRTYYMKARVIFAGINGERSITLEPISPDEGQKLISTSPYSQQK